jgi:hypothetical protein
MISLRIMSKSISAIIIINLFVISFLFINITAKPELSSAVEYYKKLGLEKTKVPSINNIKNVSIFMERGMCNGICPHYSLLIFGNGTINYEGKEFVNVKGHQIYNVSQEKIIELVKEFYKINYFSFNNTYDNIVITDQPTVNTSISINGIYKSVFDNHGANAPNNLRLLENKIDEIANSTHFLGPLHSK